MAKKSSWNPIAFVPAQVTVISSVVYIALFALLVYVHTVVPSAPSNPAPAKGINLTESWLDLEHITDGFHPYDSRWNEAVRAYLLRRVEEILRRNEVDYKTVRTSALQLGGKEGNQEQSKSVTIFDDDTANITFYDDFRKTPWTCYGESTNILVYIRGRSEDAKGDWWEDAGPYEGESGVLMNAHYDSVSSGLGATDDGVGVVTLLQLISYFTTEGQRPQRGIVALFNNGEENGLYGAHNYARHPLSQFPHTFLNLEGAGAGGRATLFRSSDAEVTKFYAQSPYPFGTVISGDGFKQRFIRSGTDYSVLTDDMGLRGLDVAFFEPRARYHTDQDDARDTSPDSVWHMLSASLATMKAMTSYRGDEFEGSTDDRGKLQIGSGHEGVWFDMFGRSFAVLQLPTLFALSVTLLVAGPVILILLQVFLTRSDRWYPLSRRQYLHSSDDDEAVHFSGLRGLFRFPIAFVVATAAVMALAHLLAKTNPYIIYSSEYSVWVMMLSVWFAVAWFFFAGADRVRPTALQRMYNLIWLYVLTWVILVAATVGENNFKLASGYFLVIYNASVFVALLISYLELFGLPTKTAYVEHVATAEDEAEHRSTRRGSQSSRTVLGQSESQARSSRATAEEDATESTSLLRGSDRRGGKTFLGIARRQHPEDDGDFGESRDPFLTKAYGDEQAWSSSLPQWTWILQFIVLVPINIIVVGQIALLLTSALNMTPADGNSPLPIYLIVAVLTVLLLLPLTPFLHRFFYYVPTFLFLVFLGCLVYNVLAFPFSRDARMKFYFVQEIDLNSGVNRVNVWGLDGYIQEIVHQMPSAAGQNLLCGGHEVSSAAHEGLLGCAWHGLAPNVLANEILSSSKSKPKSDDFKTWLDYNVTHYNNTASFSIKGRNTKHCRLVFDQYVSKVDIEDAASDQRFKQMSDDGSNQVRLFSRTWDKTFHVNVTWSGQEAKGQTGKVECVWSDVNQHGTIPAYDEIVRFAPVWSTITKASDGLVEGFKEFHL